MRLFERAAQHARRSSVGRARVLVTLSASIVGLVALVAGLAFGFWVSTDSSNPAAASATTLSTPSVSATEASATSVNITWTAGSQPPGTEYVVQRTSPSPLTICTTTGTNQLGNTGVADTCQDSGLSPATAFSYSVTAVLGENWQSSAGTASFTTMAVNIMTPVNGSTFGANWGGSVAGTSSPATGTSVSNVKVSIQQGSGSCWTGSGNTWTAACPNYVATSGTVSNWSLSLPIGDLNSVNTYNVTAQATDSSNISATATSSFSFNTTGPSPAAPGVSATVNHSASGVYWINAETLNLTDTVTPGAGTVTSVAYYYCSTLSCGSSGTFIGNGSGSSWSYAWAPSNLPASDGIYYIAAVATDSLSNTGTSATATKFGVDRTPPVLPAPSVNGLS
jgi:hypothetical protein